jgi:uncharacterized membrane protein YwzB
MARRRELVQGVSIVVVSVLMAIAVSAFVVDFVRPSL